MILCGVEIDDPREYPPRKWDVGEYKDGARTTVREMWVFSYDRGPDSWEAARHRVTMTNRGVCTFDGRQVKDERDKKLIADVFGQIKPV